MQIAKQAGTGERKYWTGFFAADVLTLNPNKEEVAAMFGKDVTEDQKENSYEGKTEKGEEYVTICPWVEADTPEKQKFRIPFYITDKAMIWPNSKKPQFVSQIGKHSTAENEKLLPEFFTNFQDFKTKENTAPCYVRPALEGEANWYAFLRVWLAKAKYSTPDTNILFDAKKLFRNVDKFVADEYRALLIQTGDDKMTGKIVCLAYVTTKEKDGELKYTQKFYSEFLPETMKDGSRWVKTMALINLCISSGNWKPMQKFYDSLTGEHGCKGSYTLTALQPFDPSQHQEATNIVFKQEGDTGTSAPVDAFY